MFCREKNPNPIRRSFRKWSTKANASNLREMLLIVSPGLPPSVSTTGTRGKTRRRFRRRRSFVQNDVDDVFSKASASSNPLSSSESSSSGKTNARADTKATDDQKLDAFLLGKALTETVLERVATETVNFIADATSLPKKIEDELEQLKREVEKRAREERRRTTTR